MGKKIFCVILLLALMVSTLSACGGSTDGGVYNAMVGSGTLRAAVLSDNAPYSYKDADGNYQGIEIALLEEIGAIWGLQVQYVPTTREEIFTTVKNGLADVAIGQISEADAELESVDLSTHYLTGHLYVVTLRGDFSSTLDAFTGKPIGVSTKLTEGAGVELYTIDDVVQTAYENADNVEQDLVSGLINGYFCYEAEAKKLLAAEKLQVQTVADYVPERYCMIVPAGNPVMTEQLDIVLRQVIESGKLTEAILANQ